MWENAEIRIPDIRPPYKKGDIIRFQGKRGIVTDICRDPMYPVKVIFDGCEKEERPIKTLLEREGEKKG